MIATTDTSTEVEVIASLDFPVSCGHRRHSLDKGIHSGDAAYIFYFTAPCGYVGAYPICATWAAAVPKIVSWSCPSCKSNHDADELVWSIGPLEQQL